MDAGGAIILLIGIWAILLPVLLYYAVARRRWGLALISILPALWFVGGWLATL